MRTHAHKCAHALHSCTCTLEYYSRLQITKIIIISAVLLWFVFPSLCFALLSDKVTNRCRRLAKRRSHRSSKLFREIRSHWMAFTLNEFHHHELNGLMCRRFHFIRIDYNLLMMLNIQRKIGAVPMQFSRQFFHFIWNACGSSWHVHWSFDEPLILVLKLSNHFSKYRMNYVLHRQNRCYFRQVLQSCHQLSIIWWTKISSVDGSLKSIWNIWVYIAWSNRKVNDVITFL